jgi:TonB family protein
MFNNLIESTSHTKEFKRRGSFLLFTTATYVVLFVVTGVISIYAYDARLEQQNLELVTLINPQDLAEPPVPDRPPHGDPPLDRADRNNTIPERTTPMLSVNNPQLTPDTISTTPNKNLPIPDHGDWMLSNRDFTPGAPGRPGVPAGAGGQVIPPRQIVVDDDQPPPPLEQPKPPQVVSKGVITGLATYLPRPVYTEMAKRVRAQGSVSVQVLIDETGRVISAKALGGSPFLTVEAQKAAMQARFNPTLLSNKPVKVSGTITYNFVLNN